MKGKEVILGILQNEPRTGYEINEIIKNQLSHFFDGTYGMIYPTLKKLENDGLVEKKQVLQDGKPNKNIFSITKKGEQAFQSAMLEPLEKEIFKSDFLLKMYFSRGLTDQTTYNLINSEIEQKESSLRSLETQLDTWKDSGMTIEQKITYDYGVAYYQATLKVLREAREKFDE